MTIGRKRGRGLAALLGMALLAACTTPASRPALPAPPVHPHGQVLWHILHDKCVPDQQRNGRPDPCAEVNLSEGVARGYVLLKDLRGVAQYLLMPTRRITGMEDPALLEPDAVDYFTPAWTARTLVDAKLGQRLPREDVSVAVNSLYGRSQDQLHLHVDCIRPDVRDALKRELPRITRRWSRKPLSLAGYRYYAVRLDGKNRPSADPFKLLAKGMKVAPADMGAWTLVLTGVHFANGAPGFVLLAARADPARKRYGSGEELQDHACAVAQAK
ncbi:CDP-diacylglycerol pyrophosphatase [Stakelama sediminis]|uniref:CDP-diacylglycerol pyrophosphatase n=2 Tax=Stakelama sediminis TaxID=463200 RepID=A0A840YZL8_9SPHN|nr:CDP-diacylglycerol pyrophosphatase [Stakelama sediminis]